MAGKKPTTFSGNRPEWKGFLECTLHDDQLTAADAWKAKPAEIFEYVHALLEDGYDLSLSYQAKDKSFTVTLKDIQPGRSTAGYAISTRDGNAADALKLALWKHFNVLVRDWSSLLAAPVKPRRG